MSLNLPIFSSITKGIEKNKSISAVQHTILNRRSRWGSRDIKVTSLDLEVLSSPTKTYLFSDPGLLERGNKEFHSNIGIIVLRKSQLVSWYALLLIQDKLYPDTYNFIQQKFYELEELENRVISQLSQGMLDEEVTKKIGKVYSSVKIEARRIDRVVNNFNEMIRLKEYPIHSESNNNIYEKELLIINSFLIDYNFEIVKEKNNYLFKGRFEDIKITVGYLINDIGVGLKNLINKRGRLNKSNKDDIRLIQKDLEGLLKIVNNSIIILNGDVKERKRLEIIKSSIGKMISLGNNNKLRVSFALLFVVMCVTQYFLKEDEDQYKELKKVVESYKENIISFNNLLIYLEEVNKRLPVSEQESLIQFTKKDEDPSIDGWKEVKKYFCISSIGNRFMIGEELGNKINETKPGELYRDSFVESVLNPWSPAKRSKELINFLKEAEKIIPGDGGRVDWGVLIFMAMLSAVTESIPITMNPRKAFACHAGIRAQLKLTTQDVNKKISLLEEQARALSSKKEILVKRVASGSKGWSSIGYDQIIPQAREAADKRIKQRE